MKKKIAMVLAVLLMAAAPLAVLADTYDSETEDAKLRQNSYETLVKQEKAETAVDSEEAKLRANASENLQKEEKWGDLVDMLKARLERLGFTPKEITAILQRLSAMGYFD